ncbi:MAG: copper resistance protein B [Cellvibrionaceae bacterium]
MLTEIPQPDLEAGFNSYNEKDIAVGSGLSNIELGLRLAYDVSRKISPHIGVKHNQFVGRTKRYKKQNDENIKNTQVLIRFSIWF